MRIAAWLLALLALSALALSGCRDASPPPGPEADCFSACRRQAQQCSEHECARGCSFVIDRLVEHQGAAVLACVAARTGACNDPVWADCAATVGVHADGGPPAPAPAQE